MWNCRSERPRRVVIVRPVRNDDTLPISDAVAVFRWMGGRLPNELQKRPPNRRRAVPLSGTQALARGIGCSPVSRTLLEFDNDQCSLQPGQQRYGEVGVKQRSPSTTGR